MDLLARIFDWLREQEAGFSAVAAILVIAGVLFAGFRWLVSRRSQPTSESTAKTTSEEDPYSANILFVRSPRRQMRFVAERGARSGAFGQTDLVWDL